MQEFAFRVEIVRTDRKRSASIQIEDNFVRVRAPKSLSDSRIHELISKRIPWIRSKLKEQSERPAPKPKEYVSGETFPYLGKNYRLKITKGSTSSIKMANGYLVSTILETDTDPQSTVRTHLEDWYRANAELRLREKTERLSRIVGATPTSVSVKNYKSRWGSCSSRGDIAYNWKIILAPHRIVDYVVVHELCHLLEHNHSSKFWRHVTLHIPDWKQRRDWLRLNPIVL